MDTDTRRAPGAGPVIDLLDPETWRSEPHQAWTWMRANEPVWRDETNSLWAVTRHRDVIDVERRSTVFSSAGSYRAVVAPEECNMIAQDDPRHRQQRMLVQPSLTRGAVARRRGEIAALVSEVVSLALDKGDFDVAADLAGQVPARMTARLLGFDESRWPDIKSWSERLMRTDMRERDPQVMAEFIAANQEFIAALSESAAARAGCPAGDLISTWIQGRIDGEPLPPEAIVHEVGLFIAGGAETTRTAIAHGMRTFADHPDQWDAMAADPGLVPGAVEEVLRWVTPLNNFFRTALVDTEISGTPVGAGDRIVLVYPSANRDEEVFEDPFVFDVRRSPNPHLSFGFGTHLCVGANLARETLSAFFAEMSARATDLAVLAEPDVEANIFARAVRSLPMSARRR